MAGPRFDDLVFHGGLRVARVTGDGHGIAKAVADSTGLSVDAVLSSPFVLAGSVEEIIELLHKRRERWGYSNHTIQQPAAGQFAPVLARLAS